MKRSMLLVTLLFGGLICLGTSARGQGDTENPTTTTPAATTPAATTPTTNTTPTARPEARDAGAKRSGLFFEVKLGGSIGITGDAGGGSFPNVLATSQFSSNFTVGYKIGRMLLGLGFSFHRAETHTSAATDEDVSLSSVLFVPTFQFHFLEKFPLAMYFTVGLPIGFGFWDDSTSTADDDTSITVIGYNLGIGMRYFIHPRFAMGVEAGFQGLFYLWKYDDGTNDASQHSGVNSFYGQVTFMAIW